MAPRHRRLGGNRPSGALAGTSRVTLLMYALVLVTAVVQTAVIPLLPTLAHTYRLTPTMIALLVALPSLAMLATSAPVGLLADRFGPRSVTLGAAALLSASAIAQSVPALPAIVVGRLAFGLAFGAVWTTGLAWLAKLHGPAGARRLSAAVTSSALGVVAGPALSGLLAGPGGVGAPFLVAGLLAAVLTALLWVTPAAERAGRSAGRAAAAPAGAAPASAARADGGSAGAGPADGALGQLVRRAPRQPGVVAGVGALVIAGVVSSVTQLLAPLELQSAGASPRTIGLMLSAAAGLYLLGSSVMVQLGGRLTSLRINARACALLALALLPAAASTGMLWVAAALLLTAVPRATVGATAYPIATSSGAEAGLGEGAVLGLLNGAWAAAMVVAPLAAGVISQLLGLRAAYLAAAAVSGLIAAWLLFRRTSRQAAPAAGSQPGTLGG